LTALVSYRKQIARQHSLCKNFLPIRRFTGRALYL